MHYPKALCAHLYRQFYKHKIQGFRALYNVYESFRTVGLYAKI
jgi:hypothetical protein